MAQIRARFILFGILQEHGGLREEAAQSGTGTIHRDPERGARSLVSDSRPRGALWKDMGQETERSRTCSRMGC